MDKQIIELISHCIVDILLEITPNNPFFGLGRLPTTIPIRQFYITKYLFNRIDDDMKNKIIYDDILYQLITEQPMNIRRIREDYIYYPSGYSPRLILTFSPEYYNIGVKYITDWKHIYHFLTGQTNQWWKQLSKIWMERTGENISNCAITKKKYDFGLMEYTNLPHDIIRLIITYF